MRSGPRSLRALAPLSFGVFFCLAAFGACMTAGGLASALVPARDRPHVHAEHHHLLRVCAVSIPARARADPLRRGRAGRLARPVGAAVRRWAFGACSRRGTGVSAAREHPHGPHCLTTSTLRRVSRGPREVGCRQRLLRQGARRIAGVTAAHFGMGMLLALRQPPRGALGTTEPRLKDGRQRRYPAESGPGAGGRSATAPLHELEAAAALVPTTRWSPLIAGEAAADQSRPRDAWMFYERAVASEPGNLDALMGLGLALTHLQRPGEAMDRNRRR